MSVPTIMEEEEEEEEAEEDACKEAQWRVRLHFRRAVANEEEVAVFEIVQLELNQFDLINVKQLVDISGHECFSHLIGKTQQEVYRDLFTKILIGSQDNQNVKSKNLSDL